MTPQNDEQYTPKAFADGEKEMIDNIAPETERRILTNFLYAMPNSYARTSFNFAVVQDLITRGTNHGGSTSAIEECKRIGIDPFGKGMGDER